MEASSSAQEVGDQATQWVARIDSRPLDTEAKAALKEWLTRDDRHRGALFRALAIWEVVGSTAALDDDLWDLLQPRTADQGEIGRSDDGCPDGGDASPEARFGRRRLLWAGTALAAATLPVAFLTGILPGSAAGDAKEIKTRLGEVTKIPLQDGSQVVVNTASQLEVEQSAGLRSVSVRQGEAWFKVAKDAARPFVVSAGNVRVRAVGTAFSVRRRDNGADVQVTEGTVEVWSEAATGLRLKVRAGTRAFVSNRAGVQRLVEDPAEIERELSWREGLLKFNGSTLSEAASEFNRYNLTKLQIDPALAGERVVGRFSTAEPDTFAQVISTAFGARVEKGEGRIQIKKN